MSKFIKYILFCLSIMFLNIINIKAIELRPTKTSVNVGESFEIVVSNRNSNSGYSLSYERGYFQVTNGCGSGGTIRSGSDSCKLTFNVKSDLQLTNNVETKISVDDIGNNASESASVNITINKSINDSSTSPSSSNSTTTTTKKTTTTTTQTKSDNAFLKSISVLDDNGAEILMTPEFKKDVYVYSLEVDGNVKTVTVNSQAEDEKANILLSNNATQELKAGENNKITITVTAESGAQKAYTLNIKKEALNADATLKELTIDEVPNFKFSAEKYEYNVRIEREIEKLTIRHVLSDDNAKIEITGNENLENGSIIKILVTAPDGTKKEYKLNIVINEVTTTQRIVSESSDKNPIVILVLSMIAFTLLGSIIYVAKKR